MLKLTVIAMGNKMPDWVLNATHEFLKRLCDKMSVQLVEIPIQKRGKSSDLARLLDKEMQLMRAAIPTNSYVIALDRTGKMHSSEELATHVQQLQQVTSHLCLLIGGPEGFNEALLALCHEKWSLSRLTLPHTLARIVLLETIYRAWSILNNHPYHK